MTSPGGSKIFREESLARLSSPERLDELLRLADRRSFIPLTTLGVLLALLLAWSVFGRVPINVHGRGILVHPRTVVEIHAPGAGRIERLDVEAGAAVMPGQTLGRIALPELETALALAREKLLELTTLVRATRILEPDPHEPGAADAGSDRHIAESRELARRLRREELASIAEERRILERQRERAQRLADALDRRLRHYVALRETGHVSEREQLDAEAEFLDAEARVSALETRLLELGTRTLDVEDRYFSRLQGLANLQLDLGDHELQVAEVRREIARLEARREQEGRIVAERGGTLREIHVVPGQFVATGDRVGTMSVGDAASPLESVVYFTVGDGKRIAVGAPIQITPESVERERFGGIEGIVRSVSELAVTVDEATSQIGNREIAAALVGSGLRIQVVAELGSDRATPSGLRWSSSRGPDMAISAGTTADARVAVERLRPIAFVLPGLKSALGAD